MVSVGVVVALLIGAGVAAYLLLRGDGEGGQTVLPIGSLAPGECWNDPALLEPDDDTITGVPIVPCDQPHANEVFATLDHPAAPGAPYPGTRQLDLDSFGLCLAQFDGFVGVPFNRSPLDVYFTFPTPDSWADGERRVVCSLYMINQSLLIGSERGSDRSLISVPVEPAGAATCPELADTIIELGQLSIDFFDSLTAEELATLEAVPPGLVPLLKGESLILERALTLGCGIDALNVLVSERAASLTATTEFGRFLADDIATNGFFSE
jgi:hypothetical protein